MSLLSYYSHSERFDAERKIKNRLNPSEDIKWGQLSISQLSQGAEEAAAGRGHTRSAELHK